MNTIKHKIQAQKQRIRTNDKTLQRRNTNNVIKGQTKQVHETKPKNKEKAII